MHTTGTFNVKVAPVTDDRTDGILVGQWPLARTCRDDLQGTATSELAELREALVIRIGGGEHSRDLEYTLPGVDAVVNRSQIPERARWWP